MACDQSSGDHSLPASIFTSSVSSVSSALAAFFFGVALAFFFGDPSSASSSSPSFFEARFFGVALAFGVFGVATEPISKVTLIRRRVESTYWRPPRPRQPAEPWSSASA